MRKLLIKQCRYCGEQFFTENRRSVYCCGECKDAAMTVKVSFKRRPVDSVENWEYHARRLIQAICLATMEKRHMIDCLPQARWDDLITLITVPYRFWDKVDDSQMGEVVTNWVEPIEALLDLPARISCRRHEAMAVIEMCRAKAYVSYRAKKGIRHTRKGVGKDGKTA